MKLPSYFCDNCAQQKLGSSKIIVDGEIFFPLHGKVVHPGKYCKRCFLSLIGIGPNDFPPHSNGD